MEREQLRAQIRAAGLRVTASRLAVLELLHAAPSPMTHAEAADAFSDQSWDRATIYRNLIDLTEVGLLSRVSLGSTWHFEVVRSDHSGVHPHFVCTECGTVECAPEVSLPVPKPRQGPKSMRRGDVEVQFHGVCDDCD